MSIFSNSSRYQITLKDGSVHVAVGLDMALQWLSIKRPIGERMKGRVLNVDNGHNVTKQSDFAQYIQED